MNTTTAGLSLLIALVSLVGIAQAGELVLIDGSRYQSIEIVGYDGTESLFWVRRGDREVPLVSREIDSLVFSTASYPLRLVDGTEYTDVVILAFDGRRNAFQVKRGEQVVMLPADEIAMIGFPSTSAPAATIPTNPVSEEPAVDETVSAATETVVADEEESIFEVPDDWNVEELASEASDWSDEALYSDLPIFELGATERPVDVEMPAPYIAQWKGGGTKASAKSGGTSSAPKPAVAKTTRRSSRRSSRSDAPTDRNIGQKTEDSRSRSSRSSRDSGSRSSSSRSGSSLDRDSRSSRSMFPDSNQRPSSYSNPNVPNNYNTRGSMPAGSDFYR